LLLNRSGTKGLAASFAGTDEEWVLEPDQSIGAAPDARRRRRTRPTVTSKQDKPRSTDLVLRFATSATVADGGPFRACIGNRCSPPSPSIGGARLVLPQETCPGRRCCIHEAWAVLRVPPVRSEASASVRGMPRSRSRDVTHPSASKAGAADRVRAREMRRAWPAAARDLGKQYW
jgi:hypothetical protein